ncbi:actin cortical patch SUR7/pH-response regulator pali [Armillaria mellea]|nr:actin cortical patch SUR7/pH-response regulator pali [Armillaria mellea]
MRGEIFVGFASLLSFAALILLIFVNVGQINTSAVPRALYLAKVNVSQYGQSLQTALLDPIYGLYTDNASEPLLESRGLRQYYQFGLYSHCGYVAAKEGICSNHTAAYEYRPYDIITNDMTANYSAITQAVVSGTTFQNSHFLGQPTKSAYYLIIIGTVTTAVALLTGMFKQAFTFFISTVFAALSTILILCGAAIWTAMINKSATINDVLIGDASNPVLVGIDVSVGPVLYLLWAAFACLFVSIIPYMITCCTYRG